MLPFPVLAEPLDLLRDGGVGVLVGKVAPEHRGPVADDPSDVLVALDLRPRAKVWVAAELSVECVQYLSDVHGIYRIAIASNCYTISLVEDIAAALRQIARGFDALADAIVRSPDQPPESVRTAALLHEWGDRGLSRAEASALFRKHGFAPQTAGGWARGDWIETRADARRYLTGRSHTWLAEQKEADDDVHGADRGPRV